jgi:hypothetical protein
VRHRFDSAACHWQDRRHAKAYHRACPLPRFASANLRTWPTQDIDKVRAAYAESEASVKADPAPFAAAMAGIGDGGALHAIR